MTLTTSRPFPSKPAAIAEIVRQTGASQKDIKNVDIQSSGKTFTVYYTLHGKSGRKSISMSGFLHLLTWSQSCLIADWDPTKKSKKLPFLGVF